MARTKKVILPISFTKEELKTMDLFPEQTYKKMCTILNKEFVDTHLEFLFNKNKIDKDGKLFITTFNKYLEMILEKNYPSLDYQVWYYVVNPIASKANSQLTNYLRGLIKDGLNNIFPSAFFMTLTATLYFTNEYNNPELVFELVKEDKPTEDKTNESVESNAKKDNEEKEFLYLSVYQNKLKVSLGTNLNQQSKKILYKISDKNDTLSIKSLSSWISAMYQGEDKEYGYKDILITASALKKLRQEEAFEEMNFEEVEEVK